MITRTTCVCCKQSKLKILKVVENFPINSNMNKLPNTDDKRDMIFGVCSNCSQIQLINLIELRELYGTSHNINIVGDMWIQHFSEFSKFIRDNIPNFKSSQVLDIGDPNYKVSRQFDDFTGKWTTIDPNCQEPWLPNRIAIKEFFDENYTGNKVDVVLHSHLFEHIYDPHSFLKKCNEILQDDGYMCFSVPNMFYLASQGLWSFSGVFWEHTYHLSPQAVSFLLESAGFGIIMTKEYRNHSTFYLAKKQNNVSNLVLKLDLLKKYNKHCLKWFEESEIKLSYTENAICSLIPDKSEVYVYSSHYNSQIMLNLLENTSYKVQGLIDRDSHKQGKYLTGATVPTYGLDILKGNKVKYLIVRHCGMYTDEIVKQIREINDTVVLL